METPSVRVLLIEDHAPDARLIQEWLREAAVPGCVVTEVSRLSAALALLDRQEFDVALVDLSLPDSFGLESFRRLHLARPDMAVIVLSGLDDETAAVTAVREGAQDYLVKSRLDSFVVGRAITYSLERQRSEERVVKSEAFYHSLVENLPQNIFRKDLDERFTFANQRFCQLLGRSLDQIIGRTDFDFFPPDLAAKYQKDDSRVIRTGDTFEAVEENVSPTGEKRYVHVVKTPIRDARGSILGTQCIFWDITERKLAEERLRQANEELARSEAALRKSNEDLKSAQLQLIQAEKMESIGTLAAGVAHEVKNPLAILQMGLNFLQRRSPAADDAVSGVFKEMRDAIERADSITRGLLDFSARQQLAVRPHDLNAVVQEALRLVRHELNSHQIALETSWADALPPAGVDKTSIQQVLVNIFMNSVHAMEGGGTLRVHTSIKEVTDTTYVEGSRTGRHLWVGDRGLLVTVEDSGEGIPQENLARIFDPFFTTKPTGKGTGLGLPVSRKIIELHGGILEIKNRPEGGVRATITLQAYEEKSHHG